jgi:hypothetical protein
MYYYYCYYIYVHKQKQHHSTYATNVADFVVELTYCSTVFTFIQHFVQDQLEFHHQSEI